MLYLKDPQQYPAKVGVATFQVVPLEALKLSNS
jgi:hypothetical protein